MKIIKSIIIGAAIVLAATAIYAQPLPGAEKKLSVMHDISVDDSKTYAIQIPWNTVYAGVFVPDIDASALGLEVYQHGAHLATMNTDITTANLLPSSDTNWVPIIDLSDGADAVILASGSDPGFVDITPFVASLRGHWIRITCGSAQTSGDDTYWFVFGSEAH